MFALKLQSVFDHDSHLASEVRVLAGNKAGFQHLNNALFTCDWETSKGFDSPIATSLFPELVPGVHPSTQGHRTVAVKSDSEFLQVILDTFLNDFEDMRAWHTPVQQDWQETDMKYSCLRW